MQVVTVPRWTGFQCEQDCKERNARCSRWHRIEWTCKDLLKQTRKWKREKMQGDEDHAWSSRWTEAGLMGVVCQIASSCSEYLNLIHVLLKIAVDFYRFLLIDNNQLNYFFSNFNLHRFSISIDDNQWIKSVDFRFRFLSVNYAWYKYRPLLLQNF